MKTAAWFAISELLLILALILVFSGWHGSVGFNFGSPMDHCSINITGDAQGARVLLALMSLLLAAVAFVGALASSMRSRKAAATLKA